MQCGNVRGGTGTRFPDPEKISIKLNASRGHASAHPLRRIVADSDGETIDSVNFTGEVLGQRAICRASDEHPQIPFAGTSTGSAYIGELLVDLPFLGDATALRAMDAYARYSSSSPARSDNHQEA